MANFILLIRGDDMNSGMYRVEHLSADNIRDARKEAEEITVSSNAYKDGIYREVE